MRESVASSPLPPSIEKAYHQKCIELKRRLNEIEEANDASRLRKHRLDRAIAKMRVNRAFLLEQLAKSQRATSVDSDRSSSPPPTPQDRPPRQQRRNLHRRSSQSHEHPDSMSSPPQAPESGPGGSNSSHSYQRATHSYPQSSPPMQHPGDERTQEPVFDRRAVADGVREESDKLPSITSLPIGTSVALVGHPGVPKEAPWTITDLHPRHQVNRDFEALSLEQQEDYIEHEQYLPYDMHGRAVVTSYDPRLGKYRHIFAEDPAWENPVSVDGRREAGPDIPRRASGRRNVAEHDNEHPHARPRLENGRPGSSSGAGSFMAVNR